MTATAPRRLNSRVFRPWLDPAEVRAAGYALRQATPVETHTHHEPAADRPDPVSEVERVNTHRLRELAAIRVGRMVSSPFAFLRGSAGLMAADLSTGPVTGVVAQICGDAHAANFGLYASPERRLVMDVNDFDETVRGPWEWDLKRLAASIVVAGREAGVPDHQCERAARDCANTYRAALREMAGMPVLDAWYLTTDHNTLEHFNIGDLTATFDRVRKKAKKNTSRKVAAKFTQRIERDEWRFVPDPPILTPVPDAVADEVVAGLEAYTEQLHPELQHLLSRFSVEDVAARIVGLGSVGLRNYVVLLHGNGEDALVMQVKEARDSAVAPHLPDGYPLHTGHDGQRIVHGQQWMQTVSDILLGWTTIGGREYLVRQFRDMKGCIDPAALKTDELDDYARVVGAVLARAHGDSADPRLISGYCDGLTSADGAEFDAAFGRFAVRYADQTERDHAALLAAVHTGRIPADLSV
jgi:uncharacterized protein (DUF2252 family)